MSWRDGDRRYASSNGGAQHLARIHGTEQDRVNCPYYFKMGACRHGDKCDRVHSKPAFSLTVMVPQMYQNPQAKDLNAGGAGSREAFEQIYIDIFEGLSKYGEIDEMVVCDNLCEHLLGNVYIKFYDEGDAEKCLKGIKGRYFAGKLLEPEFSPVTDFSQARCRQHDRNQCDRRGNCNYMHIKYVDRDLQKDLLYDQPYRGHRSKTIISSPRNDRYSRYSRDRSHGERYSSRDEYDSRSYDRDRRPSRSYDRPRDYRDYRSSRDYGVYESSRDRHAYVPRVRESRHKSRSQSPQKSEKGDLNLE